MNQKLDNLITVLDAGSSKSVVLVAEVHDGVLRYRGHGVEASRGMRKGLISELGPAAEAINKAALTAERTAKAAIETCVVGIGGTHVKGINSRGGISMGSRMREITREEVRAAVDRARQIALPPDPRSPPSAPAGVHPGRPGRHPRPPSAWSATSSR